jgi:DNA mismatch repair ATPase MutL
LEVIFDNWIVLVFIIGAITSFLKKLKESNPEKSPKQPEWKKMIPNQESYPEVTRSSSNPIAPQKRKIAQEYYEIKETYEDSTTKEKSTNARKNSERRENAKKNVVKSEIEQHLDLSPRKENVIEGVVWAEILGPPRAFKPHSARRITPRR